MPHKILGTAVRYLGSILKIDKHTDGIIPRRASRIRCHNEQCSSTKKSVIRCVDACPLTMTMICHEFAAITGDGDPGLKKTVNFVLNMPARGVKRTGPVAGRGIYCNPMIY